MALAKYLISLTADEEKIAQLLTRDAWTFFTNMISAREVFRVKDIPIMPRQGTFSIAADEDLIQYYLDYASAYQVELSFLGWTPSRISAASNGFASKLEDISGQVRGNGLQAERIAS